MQTSRRLSRAFLASAAMLLLTSVGFAADPGLLYPKQSEASDQKAGSILMFNIYSSSTSNPATANTRFNLTNTSVTSAAFVHLFFVEGGTCSVADRYICLTANQTMTFLASEQDPGTTGYLLAIAVEGNLGCPTNFNFLIGDEYVKFETGHFANLAAEAIAAVAEDPAPCSDTTVATFLVFDGIRYNRVPAVLALDSIGSRADGNDVRVWINRVGGNLFGGGGSTGTFFGILYDDAEQTYSFQIPSAACQRAFTLSNSIPRTTPRFETIIPAGQTGWFKIWSTATQAATAAASSSFPNAANTPVGTPVLAPIVPLGTYNVGLFGAAINFNPNAATGAGAFNSGHNLHKLRLTFDFYVMPIFGPSCGFSGLR